MGVCLFNKHKFVGCKCERCGKTRDEGHDFQVAPDLINFKCLEKCTVCGKTKVIEHEWNGCMCKRCFAKRDEGHDFQPVPGKCLEKCRVCSKTRPMKHQLKNCRCVRCGEVHHEYRNGRCVVCGKQAKTYDLSSFEPQEKGALVVGLKMMAAAAKSAGNSDTEEYRMLQSYPDRIEKDDKFTCEELCNIGYATKQVLNIFEPNGIQEVLMKGTLKLTYDKLEKFVESRKEE